MRSKTLSVLLVLLLLLASFSTALAQDDPMEPFCGDLDDADCELLRESNVAMAEAPSYKANAAYKATLIGIPGLPSPEITVDVLVDGAFAMDEAAIAASLEFAGLDQEGMMDLLAESPELILDIYNGLSADMLITVMVGDQDFADALSASAGLELPAELSVGLRLVEGVGYVDPTEIVPLVPELAGVEGWQGAEIGRALELAVESGDFAEALSQMDPETMAESMDPEAAAVMGLVQMLASDQEPFEQFMSIERVDDTQVDGQDAAVFVTTFDVLAFLSSPEFTELLVSLADSGALGADAPSGQEIRDTMGMVTMMGPMIFQGLTAESSFSVGLDDQYVYDYNSIVAWDLAGLLSLAAMSGQLPPELAATGDEVSVAFTVEIANSEYGEEQSIEAPEGAQVVPAEIMMSSAD